VLVVVGIVSLESEEGSRSRRRSGDSESLQRNDMIFTPSKANQRVMAANTNTKKFRHPIASG